MALRLLAGRRGSPPEVVLGEAVDTFYRLAYPDGTLEYSHYISAAAVDALKGALDEPRRADSDPSRWLTPERLDDRRQQLLADLATTTGRRPEVLLEQAARTWMTARLGEDPGRINTGIVVETWALGQRRHPVALVAEALDEYAPLVRQSLRDHAAHGARARRRPPRPPHRRGR